tara:strand:- start:2985 stop:3380 length:396 start_codon:yes stop_codon:yes gene_type:complete
MNTKIKNILYQSYKETKKYNYHSDLYGVWRRKCFNAIRAIKFMKLKEDKGLYLGWTDNQDITDKLFCLCEIHSDEFIKIHTIIENQDITDINVTLFNQDIRNISEQNQIYIDITKLKTFDKGRWYMNLLYI